MKILEFRVNFGIDDRNRVREFVAGFVVVGDDHVDAERDGFGDGVAAGDPAVDGDQHAAVAKGGQRLVKRLGSEPVTVVKTMGDKGVDDRAIGAERQGEQGAGGDAVGVVVAVDEDRFLAGNGVPKTPGGVFDAREAIRIGQIAEFGGEESGDVIDLDSARREVNRDRAGEGMSSLDLLYVNFLILSDEFPIFDTHYFTF